MGHVFLLLLQLALLLTSTHFITTGHASSEGNGGVESMMRAAGSRPPSCQGRCRSCGRCEAVQVPVTPQEMQKKKKHKRRSPGGSSINGRGPTRTALLPSSYDDHSNYKPLSWRCKCLLTT